MQVNMHEAKSQLSKLGEKAWKGETIVIAKSGKPYLDLVSHRENNTAHVPGRLKDVIVIGEDFDDGSDDIELALGADL